ncbi:hypothetical protein OC498_00375 [Acinetobacter bohemicus]|nr:MULTISPECIES: hypothetical protein [Acinetobacter]MCO8041216.1 hypothetical protein [Acinetobacter sp. S4400-12]MCU7223384.1 hypothetical protein [Acinetobacter bohemicus]
MTAASGIRHKGVFSKDRSDCGGRVDMLPLWINLPAKDKMNSPHTYQFIKSF